MIIFQVKQEILDDLFVSFLLSTDFKHNFMNIEIV